jgi:hypothetical protein
MIVGKIYYRLPVFISITGEKGKVYRKKKREKKNQQQYH